MRTTAAITPRRIPGLSDVSVLIVFGISTDPGVDYALAWPSHKGLQQDMPPEGSRSRLLISSYDDSCEDVFCACA